ncbi:hypothetical protein ACFFYR_02010 [Paraburkholderia dipogonis]|uniref:hypothetical protein n=1 Tax=Paraburkholderia dipogonis TaxID=1211383 RepID=UPI0035ECF623
MVTPDQVKDYFEAQREKPRARERGATRAVEGQPSSRTDIPAWPKFLEDYAGPVQYGPPLPAQVRALAQQVSTVPEGYELHPLGRQR